MTRANCIYNTLGGDVTWTDVYYLLNPSLGVNDLEVGYDESLINDAVTATFYVFNNGVITSNSDVDEGSLGSPNTRVVTTKNRSWVYSAMVVFGGDTNPFTPTNAAVVERHDGDTGSSATTDIGFWVGDVEKVIPGNQSTTITPTVEDDFTVMGFEIFNGNPVKSKVEIRGAGTQIRGAGTQVR